MEWFDCPVCDAPESIRVAITEGPEPDVGIFGYRVEIVEVECGCTIPDADEDRICLAADADGMLRDPYE